jgi:signal transduction histidine kinase
MHAINEPLESEPLFPPNEPERLEALRTYRLLDTAPEQEYDDITLLASQICDTPIALISLIDENRQWFKSKVGMAESETPRDVSFCAHGILQKDVFVVEDARADTRFASNPMVTGSAQIRFYAGSPLITTEGHSLGMLCVKDRSPRQLNLEQKSALQALARQVVTQFELRRNLKTLEETIAQRERAQNELQQAHEKLIEASRRAGMAEVATSVLHNVGNVLNSVNVSSSLVAEKMRNSKVVNIAKVVALIRAHENDLGNFFTNDPKGKQLPDYLENLAAHLAQEQDDMLHEVGSLVSNIVHIREIVALQQNYANTSGVLEKYKVTTLIEDALGLNREAMTRHNITVVREFVEMPSILTDKHKVLQILVNLIRNAKHACHDSEKEDKQIILGVTNENGCIRISVRDNGIGISKENLIKIFSHGFTTRKGGHGFGLHGGALAARELGGNLSAFSDGFVCGATFILELPSQK